MLWINEGFVLDDAGTLITTSYIDLREKDDRTVIPGLITYKPQPKSGAVGEWGVRTATYASRGTKSASLYWRLTR